MGTTSDEVIECSKVRRVDAVFHSCEALETTVEARKLAGFSRTSRGES